MKEALWEGKKREEKKSKADFWDTLLFILDYEKWIFIGAVILSLVAFFVTFNFKFLLVPLLYFLLHYLLEMKFNTIHYKVYADCVEFTNKSWINEKSVNIAFSTVKDIRVVKHKDGGMDIYLMSRKPKRWMGNHYPTLFLDTEVDTVHQLIEKNWKNHVRK